MHINSLSWIVFVLDSWIIILSVSSFSIGTYDLEQDMRFNFYNLLIYDFFGCNWMVFRPLKNTIGLT